jgi:hypothetical protein
MMKRNYIENVKSVDNFTILTSCKTCFLNSFLLYYTDGVVVDKVKQILYVYRK